MKKVLAMVLALAMVFALCACGNGGNNGGDSANNGDTENKNNEQAKDFYTDQIDVNGIDVNGKKIVYIAPSLDIEYWQWVEDGVRQACEDTVSASKFMFPTIAQQIRPKTARPL